MPKLSIIIPCYNSERFVSQTLAMLISQGLQECEIIAVNDGSTDNTSSILHGYEQKIPCLTVIDKENEGVSVARNVGLESAKGEYIYFLDSDDALTDGTLDFFRKTILENERIPFFAFGYKSVRNGKTVKTYISPEFDNLVLENALVAKNFLTKRLRFHICACIYERILLQSNYIHFTKGLKIGEDLVFLLAVMQKAGKGFYSARICFIYQLRDDSAMSGYLSYSENQFNSFVVVKNFLVKNNFGNNDERNFFIANMYVSQLSYYLRSKVCENEITRLFLLYESVLGFPMRGKTARIILIRIVRFIGVRCLLLFFQKGGKK